MIKNILEIHNLQGSDFDILAKAKCRDLKDVDKLVKKVMQIQGIEEVNSMVSALCEKKLLAMEIK